MELRFFTTYDRHGVDSETTLQYWNVNTLKWEDVVHVRVLERYEEEYLHESSY